MTKSLMRSCAACLLALLVLASAGCMQVETRVKLESDGSATVVERIRFSNRLLDMKLEGSPVADMHKLLDKSVAQKRAGQLGEGCTLSNYTVKDVPGGKEATATYKIGDLNKLCYCSPFMGFLDYPQNNVMKFKLEPVFKSRAYSGGKAGQMVASMEFQKEPKGSPQLEKDKKPPPGPSPKDLQVFRELLPAVRDMLDGFEMRLTFESYCPISHSGFGLRNRGAQTNEIDFFWFNDKQLDKFGDRFVDNEESMLAIAQLDFGNKTLVDQMHNFANNETMPVFLPIGSSYMWWGACREVCFRPSKELFDKHFTGKTLNYNEWGEQPTDKHIPAEFDKIGWKSEGK